MEVKNESLLALFNKIYENYQEKIEATAKKIKKDKEVIYFKIKTGENQDRGQMIYISTWDNFFATEQEMMIKTTVGSLHLFDNEQLTRLLKLVGRDYHINIYIKKNTNIVLYSRLPLDEKKLNEKADIAIRLAEVADAFEAEVMETDVH